MTGEDSSSTNATPGMVEPVSCVIAAYNAEAYLNDCIESLLSQQGCLFEIVIVDDGSVDGTRTAIEKLAIVDHRIRLISIKNSKQAIARNVGVQNAKYPLIAFLDADDTSVNDRLRRQAEFMAANPNVSALGGGLQLVDNDLLPIGHEFPPQCHQEITRNLFSGHAAGGIFLSTAMVRRRDFLEIKGFRHEVVPAEDYDLWLRLADAGKILANLPEVLSNYRVHLDSDSSRLSRTQLQRSQQALADSAMRRGTAIPRQSWSRLPLQPLDRCVSVYAKNGRFAKAFRLVTKNIAMRPWLALNYFSLLRLILIRLKAFVR